MKVKVAKWGNSLGVRLPKAAAEEAGVVPGTELDLVVGSGGFHLRTPAKSSRKLLEEMINSPFMPSERFKDESGVLSGKNELEDLARKVILENSSAVEDYKKGEEKSLNFLVGQVMKLTKGKASPKELNEVFRKLLR